MIPARIDYTESHYAKIPAVTEDESTGVVIPNGQRIALTRFIGTGQSPSASVALVWDQGGASERTIFSTINGVDVMFDTTNVAYQIDGDGVKKLSILIDNNASSESLMIGATWEATNIGQ